MTLELKSELVKVRQSGAASTTFMASDALFSLDLEGIVDMMDPSRSQFTVMELIGYKVDPFPDAGGSLEARMMNKAAAAATPATVIIGHRTIDFDTSVPDASQPITETAFINTEERWLASATKVARDDVQITNLRIGDGTTQVATSLMLSGTDFSHDWVDLRNFDGKGKLIASPRLIVRYSIYAHATSALASTYLDPFETIQVRLRYRTRKISKNQMWQMLLQQTPGETLIRSGTADFP